MPARLDLLRRARLKLSRPQRDFVNADSNRPGNHVRPRRGGEGPEIFAEHAGGGGGGPPQDASSPSASSPRILRQVTATSAPARSSMAHPLAQSRHSWRSPTPSPPRVTWRNDICGTAE